MAVEGLATRALAGLAIDESRSAVPRSAIDAAVLVEDNIVKGIMNGRE
jgi:hypothetical protein